jgi:hypothetical protein
LICARRPPKDGPAVRPTVGAIAQLGERLHGMQEVRGSIPLSSTRTARVSLTRAGVDRRRTTRTLPGRELRRALVQERDNRSALVCTDLEQIEDHAIEGFA